MIHPAVKAHWMPTNSLSFVDFLRHSRSLRWMDLSACAPSASAMEFSSRLFALQTPRHLRSLNFQLRLAKHLLGDLVHSIDHFFSVLPSFPRSVCHLTVDPASVPIQQPGGVSGDSPFLPDGSQPLVHPCWLTIASAHSRGYFPSSLLSILLLIAVIACSLFSLITTLLLPQNSTPLHTMLTRSLPVPLSLARWIVQPDLASKMLDTVISATVISL